MLSPDVVVAGGGVIGLLTARELAAGGAGVLVLERGRVGSESSWAGGGILSPLYPWRYPGAVNALAAWSQIQYPALCDLLARRGPDPEWTPSGLLVLDLEEEETERALAWGRAYEGLRAPWLEGAGGPWVARCTADGPPCRVPGLAGGARGALWLPGVAQLRNPRFMAALRREVAAAGVEIREGVALRGIRVEGGRLAGVDTDLGRLAAGACVVAAGAWTGGLLESVGGPALPVAPVKGQMILFAPCPGLLEHVVLAGGRYLIPRRDGRILAGSTLEPGGFDKTVTREARHDLAAFARALLPALGDVPVERQWAGLRPGSPRGIPFIGPHPGVAGLFVNAGHYRNGFTLAPASARLAADLVLGRPPLLDPAPYRWAPAAGHAA